MSPDDYFAQVAHDGQQARRAFSDSTNERITIDHIHKTLLDQYMPDDPVLVSSQEESKMPVDGEEAGGVNKVDQVNEVVKTQGKPPNPKKVTPPGR